VSRSCRRTVAIWSCLRTAGSTSLVSLPLQVGGQVVGVLNFGTLGRERQWQPEVVNRFRLIAQVFAGALARKRADRDLRAALQDSQSRSPCQTPFLSLLYSATRRVPHPRHQAAVVGRAISIA
jgi:GAF domain-containing protein